MKWLEIVGRLFGESKINVLKYRAAEIYSKESILTDITKLSVIPFEAYSALSKIRNRDIRSFIETHIDSHVCTHISSVCRDYNPYRIKYSVYVDPNYLLFYSECIDVEIIYTIIFGDLIKYFDFIEGFREKLMFKCSIIQSKFLDVEILDYINSLTGFKTINIRSKQTKEIIKELMQHKHEISELIVVLPCISENTLSIVKSIISEIHSNENNRIFIITSVPSMYDAKKCGISYKEFFVSYIKIIDTINEMDRVYLCESEADNAEIIINRAAYFSSYDINLKLSSEFVLIQNSSFIENNTLKYLRDCLCSSSLTRYRKYNSKIQ